MEDLGPARFAPCDVPALHRAVWRDGPTLSCVGRGVARIRRTGGVAVGDTHIFRVDKPLYDPATGRLVDNFTRVETFGNPLVHWVRVVVDPDTPSVFSFHQQMVAANVNQP